MSNRFPVQTDTEDIIILCIIKGPERYVLKFGRDDRSQILRTLGRWATDPDLSFNWFDAAHLSQRVRSLTQGNE